MGWSFWNADSLCDGEELEITKKDIRDFICNIVKQPKRVDMVMFTRGISDTENKIVPKEDHEPGTKFIVIFFSKPIFAATVKR